MLFKATKREKKILCILGLLILIGIAGTIVLS